MWLWVADHTTVEIWFIWIFFIPFFLVFFPSLLDLHRLLGLYRLCPVLCSSLVKMFPWYLQFSSRSSPSVVFQFYTLFIEEGFLVPLCCFWNSAFDWVYFPFLPFSSLLFFLQLFSGSPQITTLPSCFYFSSGWFCLLPSVQYYCTILSICSSSGTLSTRSNPLNLFVTSTAES